MAAILPGKSGNGLLQKKLILTALLFMIALGMSGCTTKGVKTDRKLPLDVQWFRYSLEYQAICLQVYRSAWQAVKKKSQSTDGPWAVILDVDETVLDNSRYQEIIFERNLSFPSYWDEWVEREECPPIPGAKAFIDSVRTLGENAHIVFITNRNAPLETATRNNLRALNIWQDGDVLLCQQSRADTKVIRRAEVRDGTGRCDGLGKRRILALIGDQLTDMEKPPEEVAVKDFRAHYRSQPEWGTRYFMLPNPMYGYWARGYGR